MKKITPNVVFKNFDLAKTASDGTAKIAKKLEKNAYKLGKQLHQTDTLELTASIMGTGNKAIEAKIIRNGNEIANTGFKTLSQYGIGDVLEGPTSKQIIKSLKNFIQLAI